MIAMSVSVFLAGICIENGSQDVVVGACGANIGGLAVGSGCIIVDNLLG